MLTAIIVAGGGSQRMGFDKTFATLAGRPVIAYTIAAFQRADCVTDILIVGREDRLAALRTLIGEHEFGKVREVLCGGRHRQDSVAAGLAHVMTEATFVAVHDAARPLITATQIEQVLRAAEVHDAASMATPVADTVKRADAEGFVCESIDRERLYAIQTPQIFRRELLQEGYTRVAKDHVAITDEVSAVERIGRRVMLVPADDYNFKITFPSDLALAELVLQRRGGAR